MTAAGGSDAAPKAPLRVLIVDDNQDAAVTLEMLIETLGHEVRLARDGPEALELGTCWRPDIVFLDLGLPGMDGYRVAQALREADPDDAPVLVAVTGYGGERDRDRTQVAGFSDHLVKPACFESIQRSLEGARPRRRSGAR